MSANITITAKTGTLKKVNGKYLKLGTSFSDAWDNPNATVVTPPESVLPFNPDCILLEAGESFTISYTPDSEGPDGQGIGMVSFIKGKITQVTGSVYVLKRNNITFDIINCNKLDDLWNSPSKVAAYVDDVVIGDIVYCAKNASFSLQIEVEQGYQKIIPITIPVYNPISPDTSDGHLIMIIEVRVK